MAGKLPAIQFYPGDWLRDEVAGCSIAAQGLWLRMMFVMHDSERYGYLVKNGSPIPPAYVANRCGVSLEAYESLLSELELAGVPSQTRDGILFNRRMVRDAQKREVTRVRVKNHRASCNADVTPMYEDEVEVEKEVEVEFKLRKPTDSELIYSEYPRKVGRRKALDSIDSAIKRLMSGESQVQMNRDDATVFLIQRVSLFAKSDAGQRGEFTPHPATWFNRSGYLDEESEWQKRDGNGKPSSISVIRERRPLEQLVRAAENAAKVESGPRHDIRRDS